MIPYGKQAISQQDIDAVVDVLKSDWLTQGPKVPAFEQAIAKYCGSTYACATNSATSALHIACLALNVGKDDIVWTSPISFVASANCALYCGAQIDFVDIDVATGNMCTDELEKKLIIAEENNPNCPWGGGVYSKQELEQNKVNNQIEINKLKNEIKKLQKKLGESKSEHSFFQMNGQ